MGLYSMSSIRYNEVGTSYDNETQLPEHSSGRERERVRREVCALCFLLKDVYEK